jgi:hypothetical protein
VLPWVSLLSGEGIGAIVVGIDSDEQVIRGCELLGAMYGLQNEYFTWRILRLPDSLVLTI